MYAIWDPDIDMPVAWFTLAADAQAYVESMTPRGFNFYVMAVNAPGSWR